PGDRSPEIAEQLVPERLLLGDDRVGAVLGKPGLGLVRGEALRRTLHVYEFRGDGRSVESTRLAGAGIGLVGGRIDINGVHFETSNPQLGNVASLGRSAAF